MKWTNPQTKPIQPKREIQVQLYNWVKPFWREIARSSNSQFPTGDHYTVPGQYQAKQVTKH